MDDPYDLAGFNMNDDPYAERRSMTFSQAEGLAPLPQQLKLRELSRELRALLWEVIHDRIKSERIIPSNPRRLGIAWNAILKDRWVQLDHQMVDEFDDDRNSNIASLARLFDTGSYAEVFDFLQFLMRYKRFPMSLSTQVDSILLKSKAAYRVVEGDTIFPVPSEVDGETLQRAFADLAATEFDGARNHLKQAGVLLTAGEAAGSARESMHAVESVAKAIAGSDSFGDALIELQKHAKINPSLKKALNLLYGYAATEEGIRHSNVHQPVANVDETDALLMLGVCASFVSYLIGRARIAKLLP